MNSECQTIDKWYVYAYYDPKDSKPFYIGKGMDLRAFSHINGCGSHKTNRKIEAIRKRGEEPLIEIIARGLSEKVALFVEMSLIEYIGIDNLTNKQRGHGYKKHGLIDASQLVAHLNGELLSLEDFEGCPTIAFRVNKLYRANMKEHELYDITRCCWRVKISKAKYCRYAMPVYHGRILEVYEIKKWFDAGSTFMLRDLVKEDEGRREFVGRKCMDKKVRNRFVGKSISALPGYASRKEFLYFGFPTKGANK